MSLCCIPFLPILLGGTLALFSAWRAIKSKNNARAWKISATFLFMGITFLFIGEAFVTTDKAGVLHEVGPLLPLGAILFILGTLGTSILTLLWLYRCLCPKKLYATRYGLCLRMRKRNKSIRITSSQI